MIQVIIPLLTFFVLIFPVGKYIFNITDDRKTFADPLFNKIDRGIYWICRIDKKDMNWKQYSLALVLTNTIFLFLGYFILRVQSMGIFNPNNIGNMSPTFSFNTAISFITNTNLQHYLGESGISYFSQMVVIIVMMFVSAASGYGVCAAFCRGICGKKMGNFYVDMVRIITRFLLPVSIIVALLLVWQGVPQNLSENITAKTIEGANQDIAMGPVASLESIKHLGTNGGGFFGGNSSTPFENPTLISNFIEMISMMLMPGSCVIMFGLMHHYKKKEEKLKFISSQEKKRVLIGKEGRTIFIAMSLFFIIGVSLLLVAESSGNPILENEGFISGTQNMEGKEVRIGVENSATFSAITTAFTTGSVNNMHDSLTPLGGMISMLFMMLNLVFGGTGIGFINMMMYMLLAVFICGLMIGKSPEYLGKKIESREMKLVVLCILIHPILILGFTALSVTFGEGFNSVTNPGFHGLSQMLYEYSSAAANNGSGFEGLEDGNSFWNITTGLVMFFGRYLVIVLQLAIAGSFMMKNQVNENSGTLKTNTVSFSFILVVIVLIFTALTFFPVLSLGPIAEHLTMGK